MSIFQFRFCRLPANTLYNSNTDSFGLILGVEVFFSEGHCSGALCAFIEPLMEVSLTDRVVMCIVDVDTMTW